jgi:hypothetical protein
MDLRGPAQATVMVGLIEHCRSFGCCTSSSIAWICLISWDFIILLNPLPLGVTEIAFETLFWLIIAENTKICGMKFFWMAPLRHFSVRWKTEAVRPNLFFFLEDVLAMYIIHDALGVAVRVDTAKSRDHWTS